MIGNDIYKMMFWKIVEPVIGVDQETLKEASALIKKHAQDSGVYKCAIPLEKISNIIYFCQWALEEVKHDEKPPE